MVCTVLTLLNSMLCSAIDGIIEKNGNWHIAVYNATAEEIEQYKAADEISSVKKVLINGREVYRLVLH